MLIAIAVGAMIFASCETPEKLMKNPDINYKLKVATDWYNKKEYYKCIPIFEELMGLIDRLNRTGVIRCDLPK